MVCKSREDCDPYFYDPEAEIEARNRRMNSHEYYDEVDPGERIAQYWETIAKARKEQNDDPTKKD